MRLGTEHVALGLLVVCTLVWMAMAAAIWYLAVRTDPDLVTLTQQVKSVCQSYAPLDLSELAAVCRRVGYQQ